jgi:hypothetical protein
VIRMNGMFRPVGVRHVPSLVMMPMMMVTYGAMRVLMTVVSTTMMHIFWCRRIDRRRGNCAGRTRCTRRTGTLTTCCTLSHFRYSSELTVISWPAYAKGCVTGY